MGGVGDEVHPWSFSGGAAHHAHEQWGEIENARAYLRKCEPAVSKQGGHDLIIMGVQRRPGDKLFFGDTAAAVFERSSGSVLFLSS